MTIKANYMNIETICCRNLANPTYQPLIEYFADAEIVVIDLFHSGESWHRQPLGPGLHLNCLANQRPSQPSTIAFCHHL